MSKPLKDPELPPGAIVKIYEDGGALRNDGVTLTPASQNPWYVLATVAGEQEGTSILDIDRDLHAENRRFWNGWMCQGMEQDERAALAEKLGLPEEELKPLNAEEMAKLTERFEAAFPDQSPEEMIPTPDAPVDFGRVHFPSALVLKKCAFIGNLFFQASHFAELGGFQKAHFTGDTFFDQAHFTGPAYFEGVHFAEFVAFFDTHFIGPAWFQKTHFAIAALFSEAQFTGRVFFQEAYFKGEANFQKAHFHESADFSDGCFKAKTVFDEATFKGEVPQFFHREMHQDTGFTDDAKLWPDVTAKNAQAGKRAYTRLRQVAAEIYDPDLEHFFLRQEMRCKEVLAGRFETGLFVLYRKLADSGISVKRPAAVLVGLWALGAAMFWGYFLAPMGHEVHPSVTASPGWSGIGLSFANVFAFLGLSRAFFADVLTALPIALKYFAGMQTVFGAVFFFLLALGLRNRFRLK